MAKEIILYNLRDDVKEKDYVKWCEDYKGPLLIGLPGSKSFTLLKMNGGSTGEWPERQPTKSNETPVQLYRHFGYNQPRGLGKVQGEQGL